MGTLCLCIHALEIRLARHGEGLGKQGVSRVLGESKRVFLLELRGAAVAQKPRCTL